MSKGKTHTKQVSKQGGKNGATGSHAGFFTLGARKAVDVKPYFYAQENIKKKACRSSN